MRELQGAQIAGIIARSMVVPPLRDGGQSQFAVGPVASQRAETLAPLIDWMVEHLDEEHSVAALARRANLSERTFARRFRDELGATPAAWLTSQRVQRAQQLLEATDLGLDAVAQPTAPPPSAAAPSSSRVMCAEVRCTKEAPGPAGAL